jgi:hypothetical protein
VPALGLPMFASTSQDGPHRGLTMKAEAKHLGTAGINAGYTNEQIKEACGGDIETYLLQERGRSLSERLKLGMQRDKYSG